ncbi:MAG: signal peptidase [Gaiellales bacterium]|nr:signal peptidase [Gaiellales bacterium]
MTAETAAGGRRPRAVLLAAGVLLLLVGAVILRAYVAEPFAIPTESMAPTLRPGDHVLVEKLSYRFGSPRRGDLVVFAAPDGGALSVKRIVGLAGDRVAIEDGVLAVNGKLRREPYVDHGSMDSVYFGPVVVPRGDVFVMGDNRADSHDSRDYGAVPRRSLVGRVLVTLWPVVR